MKTMPARRNREKQAMRNVGRIFISQPSPATPTGSRKPGDRRSESSGKNAGHTAATFERRSTHLFDSPSRTKSKYYPDQAGL